MKIHCPNCGREFESLPGLIPVLAPGKFRFRCPHCKARWAMLITFNRQVELEE